MSFDPKHRVLISAPYMIPVMERFRPYFEEHGIELVVPHVEERLEEADLLPIMGDIDGVICGDDRFTRRVLENAPRLRVVSKWGTGIDSIDQTACRELDIAVRNTPNAFSEPVADSALGYILAFARNITALDSDMKAGVWNKIPGRALRECTLGVIGVGNVGKAVIRRAAAFGMTILGTDPTKPADDFLDTYNVKMVDQTDLLSQSDFVSINCDLNPTSFHLIDSAALSAMKPTAVLVNTARGPIVDEEALITALENGQIAGAALDVFETEPLPTTSPLRSMSNVFLAPHNSNSSPQAWEHVHQNTIKNLMDVLNGGQQS